MAAFIDKMQFAVGNQFVKFMFNKRRCDGIVIAPDQAGRLLNAVQFFAQVIADGAFCQCNNFDHFEPVVGDFKYLIYQFVGGHCRVVKCKRCFISDVFFVAPFGIGISHTIFKQAGTSGKDQ